ncbi:MAG: thiamine-phosphate kinase [Acidobacteria bacterium]|jgi:thiamine-monophosphate kinase|nr:thiamine-phosphate kinase [Acidobacteriota bacterium]
MDEAGFVQFLKEKFPFKHGIGIGDDTSVVKMGDYYQLITLDLLVENVHFNLDYYTLEQVALKSIAVNLSDIAAMGGQSQYFYLGLGFPKLLCEEDNVTFFNALAKGCRQWNVDLAGGDFSSAANLFISITMVGRAKNPIYRHNAQTGDLIGITGITGESAIGLKLLKKGIRSGHLVEKHITVTPEIEKGPILANYVNAMIDVSDGLLIDLKRVLTASNKGAKIFYDHIPVTKKMQETCAEHGWDEHEPVLAGGEDYVLLFTINPEKEKELRKENIDYHIIGEITSKANDLIVTDKGKLIQPRIIGYDHFK